MSILQHNEPMKTNIQVMVRVKPHDAIKPDIKGPPLAWTPSRITLNEDGKRKDFTFDYVFNPDANNDKVFNKVGEQVISNAFAGYNTCVFAYGQSGCFAAGTPIMMFNGHYKPVEHIKIGDQLMGDNNTPRNVLKLYSGYEPLYTIMPDVPGFDSYTVNYSHTLVCKINNQLKEIPLSKYLYHNFSYPVITHVPQFKANDTALMFAHHQEPNLATLTGVLTRPIAERLAYFLNLFSSPITCESCMDLINPDINTLIIQLGHSLGYATYMTNSKIHLGDTVSEFTPIIKYRGVDRYYGFKLDNNGRFIGAGYNVLRNSGKTHTMLGDDWQNIQSQPQQSQPQQSQPEKTQNTGLIPRICRELFERQATNNGLDVRQATIKYKLQMSYLEIYSEEVKDLLTVKSDKLTVRLDPKTGPFVESLTKADVSDFTSLMHLIISGNTRRTVASTMLNDVSSRSHAIVTIYFTQLINEPNAGKIREVMSKINLVDLAGSERVGESGVTGINFKEATLINKSLSTLGRVISTLSDKFKSRLPVISQAYGYTFNTFNTNAANSGPQAIPSDTPVPFRDSKLTFILKESLAGNSKTYLIATITGEVQYLSETLSTLRFASNAKQIINKVKVNEDPDDSKILTYNDELKQIKRSILTNKSPEETQRLSIELQFREELLKADKTWEQKMAETVRLNSQTTEAMQRQIDSLKSLMMNATTAPPHQQTVRLNAQQTLQEQLLVLNQPVLNEKISDTMSSSDSAGCVSAEEHATVHIELQNQRKLFAGERLVMSRQIQQLTTKCAALEAELLQLRNLRP